MKRIIIILGLHFISFFVVFCKAQSSIDSLKMAIYSAPDEPAKMKALSNFCSKWDSFSEDSLKVYNNQLRAIAQKLKDDRVILLAEFYDAVFLLQKNKVDSALALTNHIFDSYRRMFKYDEQYLQFYRLKGNLLLRMARYEEVSRMNYTLLQQAESRNDTTGIALAYLGLGNVNNRLQKKSEALQWYMKALHTLNTAEARRRMSYLFSNIAIAYYKLGKQDSALYYIRQGVDYSRQSGNLTDYANALSLQGGILSEFGQPGLAEKYFTEALDVRKKIGDVYYVITDMAQFALFYLHTKQPEKGIRLCLEGLNYQQKYGTTAGYSELYQALARNYKAAGLFKEATEAMERYLAIRDSVYEKNSADLMAEMQARYEVQKKENTIIQQKLDLSEKNKLIYSVVSLLVIVLGGGILLFRHRRNLQLSKLREIEAEQKRRTTQAVMQAENEERKRIASDLHDSVAQKLVAAKMNIESLRSSVNSLNESQTRIISNAKHLLEDAATEVRSLSHTIMPQSETANSFTDMLKDFLDKVNHGTLIINFNSEGEFTGLTEQKSVMIYRIIQEAVQNVLKHSCASQLDIAVIGEVDSIDITIEDNGKGFEPGEVPLNSMGLRNIRSRTTFLGGSLDLHSKPGAGTALVFHIPL